MSLSYGTIVGLGIQSPLYYPIRVIFGLYWDNGKENGNYYLGFRGLELIAPLK